MRLRLFWIWIWGLDAISRRSSRWGFWGLGGRAMVVVLVRRLCMRSEGVRSKCRREGVFLFAWRLQFLAFDSFGRSETDVEDGHVALRERRRKANSLGEARQISKREV